MRAWIGVAAAAAALAGCGSSTAPGSALNGVWHYTAGNLAGEGATCQMATKMTLSERGGTFTGTYGAGYLSCATPTGAADSLMSGAVAGGSVTGSTLQFQFDSASFTNSGRLNTPHTMSGTATLRLTVKGQPYTVSGTWSAVFE